MKLTKLKVTQGNRTSIVECYTYQYTLNSKRCRSSYTDELILLDENEEMFCVFRGELTFEEIKNQDIFTFVYNSDFRDNILAQKDKEIFDRKKSILSDKLEIIAHNIIDVARSIKE